MLIHEQEQTFAALRQRYPDWSLEFTNGYVHGMSDIDIRKEPRPGYLSDADEYALGYQWAWRDRGQA